MDSKRSWVEGIPSVNEAYLDQVGLLSVVPWGTLQLHYHYQVDRITVRHVPVLSSSVQVVDSARDLFVVIDSHLTMVDHVTAVYAALPTFICGNYA